MTPEEYEHIKERTIVGLTEKIIVVGQSETKELIARIDTGATKSSIDLTLATRLGLGPVVDSKLVKSAHGVKLRPVVQSEIEIGGKKILAKFTLADRGHMRYLVLIGQNILKKDFLVDPGTRADSAKKLL
ncbi:ATP-dependent zinc protease [Candidatus Woesearchaeota archaeon]|nr:ATP-dependent zinc protease [Candidatus Woesearchaeota archaeon]